jgi:hypothetical protein
MAIPLVERVEKIFRPAGNGYDPTRLSRVQSYRTDAPGYFHLSTYSRSRVRRSARLHTALGLSTKPAPKRSIRCWRYWELEIRSRKWRLTYGELRWSIEEYGYVMDDIPLSSSGCPSEGETTGWAPRLLEETQTPRWDASPTLNV